MGKFLLSTLLLLTTAFMGHAQEWIPVTDIAEINTTDEYLLVCPSLNIVAGTTTSSSRLSGMDVTLTNNKITTLPEGAAKIKFENSSNVGKYKIYISNIESTNKYLGGSTNAKISLVATGVDATINISNTTSIKLGSLNLSGNSGKTKWFALYNDPQKAILVYKLNNIIPTKCEEPIFRVNGKVVTKDSNNEVFEGNTISVTCPTKDSNIEWGYQLGNNKYPLEGSEFTIPNDFSVGATYTFYANASCFGENNTTLEASSSIFATIVKKPNVVYTNKFKKVTDVSELEAGAKYVIAYSNNQSSKAMSTAINSNNRLAIDVTITDGVLEATDEILIIKLEGEKDNWILNAENYNGTDKYFSLKSDATDIKMTNASSATKTQISFSSQENVEIKSNSASDKRIIKYYSSNPSFRYYTDANGVMCQLYRQIVEVVPEAPAMPDLHESSKGMLNGNIISGEGTANIKFADVEDHIDLYYKFIDNTQAAEPVALAAAEHNHDGYTLYNKADGLNLTTSENGKTLEVFACDTNTGLHSEPVKYTISMITTGVAEIEAAGAGEVRWFDMQGREVKGQPEKGIYVRVANGKASKVIL